VRVEVTTRGFADAFDGDMTLIYNPDTTAAIILSERPGRGGVFLTGHQHSLSDGAMISTPSPN
jgi:hypothetical protein